MVKISEYLRKLSQNISLFWTTLLMVNLMVFPWHSYGTSPAIWCDHTVLPATRHKWTRPTIPHQAGRYSVYLPRRDGRLTGWVDLYWCTYSALLSWRYFKRSCNVNGLLSWSSHPSFVIHYSPCHGVTDMSESSVHNVGGVHASRRRYCIPALLSAQFRSWILIYSH